MGMPAELLAHVRIQADVLEKEVTLENPVLFDHPVVGFGYEGFQDCGGNVGMVPGGQRIADVVQQGAHDIFLVFAALVRERRGQQGMLQAVDGKAAVFPAEQFQMADDAVGKRGGKRPVPRRDDFPVSLGAFLHRVEAGTLFGHVPHHVLRNVVVPTVAGV